MCKSPSVNIMKQVSLWCKSPKAKTHLHIVIIIENKHRDKNHAFNFVWAIKSHAKSKKKNLFSTFSVWQQNRKREVNIWKCHTITDTWRTQKKMSEWVNSAHISCVKVLPALISTSLFQQQSSTWKKKSNKTFNQKSFSTGGMLPVSAKVQVIPLRNKTYKHHTLC